MKENGSLEQQQVLDNTACSCGSSNCIQQCVEDLVSILDEYCSPKDTMTTLWRALAWCWAF